MTDENVEAAARAWYEATEADNPWSDSSAWLKDEYRRRALEDAARVADVLGEEPHYDVYVSWRACREIAKRIRALSPPLVNLASADAPAIAEAYLQAVALLKRLTALKAKGVPIDAYMDALMAAKDDAREWLAQQARSERDADE